MRTVLRYLTPFAAAAAAAAILAAPAASAQTHGDSQLPKCEGEGGAAALGGSATECATPGNVQIVDTPAEQEYVGPWGDMFGGDGFFFP